MKYYTTGEVAEIFHVSKTAVWWWVQKGKMKAIRTPGGRFLIPEDEVLKYLKPYKPVPEE